MSIDKQFLVTFNVLFINVGNHLFKKNHKHSLQCTIVCMNDIKVGVVIKQLLLAGQCKYASSTTDTASCLQILWV